MEKITGKDLITQAKLEYQQHWNEETLEQLKQSLLLSWKIIRPTTLMLVGISLVLIDQAKNLVNQALTAGQPDAEQIARFNEMIWRLPESDENETQQAITALREENRRQLAELEQVVNELQQGESCPLPQGHMDGQDFNEAWDSHQDKMGTPEYKVEALSELAVQRVDNEGVNMMTPESEAKVRDIYRKGKNGKR